MIDLNLKKSKIKQNKTKRNPLRLTRSKNLFSLKHYIKRFVFLCQAEYLIEICIS